LAQAVERVDCVVGSDGVGWCVDEGEFEGWVVMDGETGHGDAVFKAGGVARGFERLEAYGREKNLIEAKGLACGAGDGHVSEVRRVEAPAEEGYPHGVMVADAEGGLVKGGIAACLGRHRFNRIGIHDMIRGRGRRILPVTSA